MLLPSTGGAQDAATYVGRFAVAEKTIALPPGQWRALGDEAYAVDGRRKGVSSMVRSIVLGQVDDRQASALVVIRTNEEVAPGGFGATEDCDRTDLYLAQLDTAEDSPIAACTFIGHVLHDVSPEADPAWRDAVARIARDNLSAPEMWLSVGYRFADDDDILDVRYFLNPDLLDLPEGPASVGAEPQPGLWDWVGDLRGYWRGYWQEDGVSRWAASPWAPENVAQDPQRRKVIDELTKWAAAIRPAMRQGFKGRRTDALEWPTPWMIAFRLKPEREEPAIEDPRPVPPETLALWKAGTYRVLDIIATIIAPLAITGSAGAAAAVVILDEVIETGAYYGHELVWQYYGADRGPLESYTELPAAGITR